MPEHLIDGRIIRGLTLWRPWPWCFIHAGKRVENRKWPPPKSIRGGWLALHAGKRFDRQACDAMRAGRFDPRAVDVPERPEDHPHSRIVAVGRLESCYQLDAQRRRLNPYTDPWAFGPYVWELQDLQQLPDPVPCLGAQGLWKLPDDVFELVRAQVVVRGAHG